MVRLCRHPGCNRPVRIARRVCSYCEEHTLPKWVMWRMKASGSGRWDAPRARSEREIRADLRAQLYAMLVPWEQRLARWRQNGAFLGGE